MNKKRSQGDYFTHLMDIREVARYLGVHEMTVYKLLKQSYIPAFKLGGQWRFKKDLLDAWLNERMRKSA
ncbi:MAG: helix-turn-helix domain-containing protein [Candidatus Omnitrophica bacterium]|nr:helix-turn-helix domain-containing protein [Candidatus Omnitrophota bacterium]